MIDTIKYQYDDSSVNLLNLIPQLLDGVTGEHKYSDGYAITGNLGNLKIVVKENYLRIENSLCKYYLGNNIQTLSREEIKLANEKLSDALHIDINKAIVKRFDIGMNFIMNYPPKLYFDKLGTLSRYSRLEQPNGVYYRTNNKQLLFYDKLKEQKQKKGYIPIEFLDKNILRYELKFLRNVKQELKESIVTPKTLSNPFFFDKLTTCYYDMYNRIEKLGDINLSIGNIKGVKGMSNTGIICLLQQYGEENILKQIDTDYIKGFVTAKERRNMIEKIRQPKNRFPEIYNSETIDELNNLITNSNELTKFIK